MYEVVIKQSGYNDVAYRFEHLQVEVDQRKSNSLEDVSQKPKTVFAMKLKAWSDSETFEGFNKNEK